MLETLKYDSKRRRHPGGGAHGMGRRMIVASLLVGFVVATPLSAQASPETLKRSVSNLSQAPLDLLLSPMVGLVGVVTRMREQDDPVAVRVVFGGPGVVWNTGVNIGASVIRFVTGAIELVPGVLLLPFEADLDPLFAPVDNGGALVELETPCCLDVKFGIDYTAAEY